MTEGTSDPTLLNLPIEIRLRIYHYVFDDSTLKICGNKFLRRHHKRDLPDRGKHVAGPDMAFGPAHVCSQLRAESLDILLQKTTLSCCHMGLRLVETHLPRSYQDRIRRVSIDTQSFGTRYIHSLRPDVLHKLCKQMPVFPQLQSLVVRTGRCFQLPKGFKREDLQSTHLLTDGEVLYERARSNARSQAVNDGNATLAGILMNRYRGFDVHIHTFLADFHPQDEEGSIGVAAYFGFDCDSGELQFWELGERPVPADYYNVSYSKAWYRDRRMWQTFRDAAQLATMKLLDSFR